MDEEDGPLSDSEGQAEAVKAQGLARHQLEEDIRAVMGTDAGRRFAAWIINGLCCLNRDPDGGEATHATSKALGRQAAGRDLLAHLERVVPDCVHLTRESFSARRTENERARE